MAMDCSVKPSSSHHEYHIGGVLVKFPVKAYPTQISMMAKIIQALNHKENALLESPTGSGKSLALLCSALAWQEQAYAKIEQEEKSNVLENLKSMNCICDCHGNIQATPTSYLHTSLTDSRITIDLTTSPNTTLTPQVTTGILNFPLLLVPALPAGTVAQPAAPAANQESTSLSTEQDGATKPTSKCGGAPGEQFIEQLDGSTGPSASKKGADGETSKSSSSDGEKKSSHSVVSSEDSSKGAGMDKMSSGEMADDEDFKVSNKRFRTPSFTAEKAQQNSKKRRTKMKGVNYEDVPESVGSNEPSSCSGGHPQWKMEFPCGVVPGVGVPQSQIMDSDFPPPSVRAEVTTPSVRAEATTPSVKAETTTSKASLIPPLNATSLSCTKCSCSAAPEPVKTDSAARRMKAPKIFFSTRTHKQIAQITHELARTAYSGTPMCILASREHTCIHPEVSKSKNKNEECKKKLDGLNGELCSYYLNVAKRLGSQAQLRQYGGFTTAWDIEDLVTLGKRTRTCPYFTSRGLKEEADIIFCPYNYLIDPLIRDQMLLEIENKVIILDEAHNMEDSARDAASLSITSVQLQDVAKEIDKVKEVLDSPNLIQLRESYLQLQAFNAALLRWIEVTSTTLPARGYEQAYGIWNGPDFLPIMEKQLGLTPATLIMYKAHLESIFEANADKEQKEETPTISVNSLNLFKHIFMIASYLFKDSCRFLPDYRMSLIKSMTTLSTTEPGGWMSRKRRNRVSERVWTFTLNFWCLNPAVAFSDMNLAQSIILTSGTLSPMSSFSSELGVSFPIQLEANHIIPESQTWITSISHGPNGRSLLANYQNTETFEFQDELGEVLLHVCQTVPYGVLCFFSSYKMMEKLTNRWQDTGLWYKILREKFVVSEPRSGRKEDFESAMSSFYNVVMESSPQRTSPSGEECQTGALFLAVCRGKVSEGLDFANNNARAVVTVGIPFPSIKDKQVELKREYNNEYYHSRGLLNGSEWYEIQAYRALNQALGRCIRHKKDWGALILVDERYNKGPHYTKGLSKWVRQRICHKKNFSQALVSLRRFIDHMTVADQADMPTSAISTCEPDKPNVTCGSPALGVSMTSPLLPPLPTTLNSAITHPHANHSPPSSSVISSHTTDHTPLKSPSSPAVTTHASIVKESGGIVTSTPVKTGVKSKITDFVLSARNDSHGSFISSTPQRSRFEYPRKMRTNSNTLISLSQLHSATMTPKIEPNISEESPSPPDVVLDDSLAEYTSSELHTPHLPTPSSAEAAASKETCEKAVRPGSPLGSSREESPILFDTPSTVGGSHQPLAVKLAKRALGVRDSTTIPTAPHDSRKYQQNTDHTKLVLEIQKNPQDPISTTELSPLNLETRPQVLSEQSSHSSLNGEDQDTSTDDIDATPPLAQSERPVTPQSGGTVSTRKGSEDKPSLSARRAKRGAGKDQDSPLGQPKVRRVNTRMASKKRAVDKQQATLHSFCREIDSTMDDDFRSEKKSLPLERKPIDRDKKEKAVTVSCSSCHTQLTEALDHFEKIELKRFFTEVCDREYKTLKSSKLWRTLTGVMSTKRTLHTLAFASQLSKCQSIEAGGEYNAVWDDGLGICYSIVKCSCERLTGVAIHASTDSSHPLVGKTLLTRDQATLNSD